MELKLSLSTMVAVSFAFDLMTRGLYIDTCLYEAINIILEHNNAVVASNFTASTEIIEI